jgi:hypothetical protein
MTNLYTLLLACLLFLGSCTSTQTLYTTHNDVPVYLAPTTYAPQVVGYLPHSRAFTKPEPSSKKGWYYVLYGDNQFGFIEARYLGKVQPAPTASIPSVPRPSESQSVSSGSSSSPVSSSSGSHVIYTGPRGGRYYINKNGNKTYVKKGK